MAPTIQPPSQDTINALQNVLKRRIDTNRIIKEREKKMLSREDYQMMEVVLNNKQFLQLLDADNTKASIYYIRQKFMSTLATQIFDQVELIRDRYCDHRDIGFWHTAILKENCNKERIMSFLY
jgi:hypothetical protein